MPKLDAAKLDGNPTAAFFAAYQTDPRYRTPQPLFTPDHKPLLAFAFEEIEAKYGSVEGYLDKELGVSAADIAKLRAMYLE
jgi:protein-tyrosine phosphatase